jgi:hypothetical protein
MMGAKHMSHAGRLVTIAVGIALAIGASVTAVSQARPPAPTGTNTAIRLTDRELWQLSVDASEPNGFFRSDNLTSNELGFERVIPDLLSRTRPGTAYLGVGPEQNFTYIVAVRPAIAVIFDIRRGNLQLQLMYKAIFELTQDRADFVSMLFSRPRPRGLTAETPVDDLFAAFKAAANDEALYERNLAAITERLLKVHALPLPAADVEGISHIYRVFFERGTAIRFSPNYAELMSATDEAGAYRSYLASESNFTVVRDLETSNLVVPIVGDFAGPKAIRRVGAYLKAHGLPVGAFYLSNVEQYLQDGKWAVFCRNVATLPLDTSSTFIRSTSGRGSTFGPGFISSLGSMATETRNCPSP